MFFVSVFFLANLLILAAIFWVNRCKTRTLRQRQIILYILKELAVESQQQNIWEQYKQHKSVSYRQHLKCLLLFGNPWKLYKDKNNEQK